ncbi:MAG: dTDP-4-dehydrorhamnose 3,5-epimerase family protein [Rhodobacteraceae bacterium]|nr:dTDP-4-dehydrorhamnose 3,5-epimerase family protein [Paracoccaceae bacterium]
MSIDFQIADSAHLDGVRIVTPSVFEEARGNIWTSYLAADLDALLPDGMTFTHDKFSQSLPNVLRGIHGDHKSWKLVTCVWGEVHQVVVDMREASPTYLKHERFVINRASQRLILIPPGMGNAYYVSGRDGAVYHYKLAYAGAYIDAADQFTVAWNDPRLNIDWPVSNPILSNRDAEAAHGSD